MNPTDNAALSETAKRIAERAPEMFGQASGPLGWPNAESKLAKLIEAALTAVREAALEEAAAEIAKAREALERVRGVLADHYSHLPSEQYPGPATGLITQIDDALSKGAQSDVPLSEAVKEIGALFDPAEVERVNKVLAEQGGEPS